MMRQVETGIATQRNSEEKKTSFIVFPVWIGKIYSDHWASGGVGQHPLQEKQQRLLRLLLRDATRMGHKDMVLTSYSHRALVLDTVSFFVVYVFLMLLMLFCTYVTRSHNAAQSSSSSSSRSSSGSSSSLIHTILVQKTLN